MLIFKLGSIFFRWAVHLVAPFNQKAKKAIRGRKNGLDELKIFKENCANQAVVWFHCASYGEFEQGRPLIEDHKALYPEEKILLTFFSPSGFEAKKNYKVADKILYLPFDSKRNARAFVSILRPEKTFFIKYEFWPYYLQQLDKLKLKTYLVSGIFRQKHILFKLASGKKILRAFDHFFVQDNLSASLLEKAGFNNATIAGDSRIDRVIQNSASTFANPKIESFCANKKIIIAGSTWEKDQEILIEFIRKNNSWSLVIVPHELGSNKLQKLHVQLSDLNYCFYTDNDINNISSKQILVLDTIGMLSKVYRYADITYVGGGFGKGIHNILEPASYLKPVIIGPNYKKFKEARELVEAGVVGVVRNSEDLEKVIKDFTNKTNQLRNILKLYLETNKGSVKKILDFISIST